MGLFNVHMSLLYGEGDQAFQRLQRKILKRSGDESLFAWTGPGRDMLAAFPENFVRSGAVFSHSFFQRDRMALSYNGLKLTTPLYACEHGYGEEWRLYYAVLNCTLLGDRQPLGIYLGKFMPGSSGMNPDLLCRIGPSGPFSSCALEKHGQAGDPGVFPPLPSSRRIWSTEQLTIIVRDQARCYEFFTTFGHIWTKEVGGMTLLT